MTISVLPRFIPINTIICSNQYGDCSENIKKELETIKGESWHSTNDRILDTVQNTFRINEINTQYVFPNTLKVNIIEARYKFIVENNDGERSAIVDQNGNVLTDAKNSNLPVLKIADVNDFGNKVDEDIFFAGNLLFDLYYSKNVESAILENDGIYLNVDGKYNVIFPVMGDRELLIGSLNAIIFRLNTASLDSTIDKEDNCEKGCYVFNECKDICTVDLRFNNPVIR